MKEIADMKEFKKLYHTLAKKIIDYVSSYKAKYALLHIAAPYFWFI